MARQAWTRDQVARLRELAGRQAVIVNEPGPEDLT